jgi:hypothetical protein
MKHLHFTIITVIVSCFLVSGIQAQTVPVNVKMASYPRPVVDGIEEEAWDDVDPVDISTPFGTEQPTVTAYWKALWDCGSIYVLINVEDDDHYPAWESEGNSWEYDKPEVYFDVNDTLIDGLGPADANSGHYQFSPGFSDDYDMLHTVDSTAHTPGGTYAHSLTGENYVYECAVTISSMHNKHGIVMNSAIIGGWEQTIGFDVTIIDQDEGVTTARQRLIWQCGDGSEAEAWNSMDACGTIAFVGECFDDCWWGPGCLIGMDEDLTVHLAVYPNPVKDFIAIDTDFDRVVIHAILGREIVAINRIKSDKIDTGNLPKGIYIIRVFKADRFIGSARFIKI